MKDNLLNNIPCQSGDTLFVPSVKLNKILTFKTDCIKIFPTNLSIHGYLYGKYTSNHGQPTEYSIGDTTFKRILFTSMEKANEYLEKYRSN